MKEVEDSSLMDQNIIKKSAVRKQMILPQSPQHTMKEVEDSSSVDHTSTKLHFSSVSPFLLLLSKFLIPK